MSRGYSQKVAADNGVAEGRYVALAIAGILGIGALLLPHHQAHHGGPDLAEHQVTFDLVPTDVRVAATDLKLSHEEIRDWHQDNLDDGFDAEAAWPGVDDLKDAFLPPFSQGQWQQPQAAIYLGLLADHALVLNSQHAEPALWVCDNAPRAFDDNALKANGCQQLVSHPSHSHKDH
ncbi:conserved hypothetical protein [Ferrimonas balearica DSM 9799]|uniref:Uncharacterized protein n=1 Tax=Ferrimonas balearica (strain DSM 9799 / CCM 4581 / KCTC 23876 / PAT) TaxID=550540 RepID=E1SS29_FERBD|nr:hypothetical protein [Ferrimonas balearica]ADN75984.1 conserved hypothetical protein [Ferrimonas balearica DSM 9799]